MPDSGHPDDHPSRAELSADAHEEALIAAVDVLMKDSGLPRWGPHRAAVKRRQRLAIDAYLEALNAH